MGGRAGASGKVFRTKRRGDLSIAQTPKRYIKWENSEIGDGLDLGISDEKQDDRGGEEGEYAPPLASRSGRAIQRAQRY